MTSSSHRRTSAGTGPERTVRLCTECRGDPATAWRTVHGETTVKIPLDMYERVQRVAETRKVGVSTLIREWIAAGLTAEAEDQQISLAQLRTAIANVVQSGHAA
jgi:predicted DNA-binding protein